MKLGKVWYQLAWARKAINKIDQATEEIGHASYDLKHMSMLTLVKTKSHPNVNINSVINFT